MLLFANYGQFINYCHNCNFQFCTDDGVKSQEITTKKLQSRFKWNIHQMSWQSITIIALIMVQAIVAPVNHHLVTKKEGMGFLTFCSIHKENNCKNVIPKAIQLAKHKPPIKKLFILFIGYSVRYLMLYFTIWHQNRKYRHKSLLLSNGFQSPKLLLFKLKGLLSHPCSHTL